MWTSTVRSVISTDGPQTRSKRRSREKTLPGRSSRHSSNRNSVGLRWTSREPRRTLRVWRSSCTSPRVRGWRAIANRLRRNKARTRAVSSGIERGRTTKSSAPAENPRKRKNSSPRAESMMIWQHSCSFLGAQSDTNFEAGYARQHPIENDKIGRRVGELSYGFVPTVNGGEISGRCAGVKVGHFALS
jgi:hypothetical protein